MDHADEVRWHVYAFSPALGAELILKVILVGHKVAGAVRRDATGLCAPAGLCRAGLLFCATPLVGRRWPRWNALVGPLLPAGKLVSDLLIVEKLDDDLEHTVLRGLFVLVAQHPILLSGTWLGATLGIGLCPIGRLIFDIWPYLQSGFWITIRL
jgi:hypothetical protein